MPSPAPPAPPPRSSASPPAEPEPVPMQEWCGEMDYPTFDHERGADADGDGLGVGDQQGDEPEEGGDEDDGYECGRYQDLDEATADHDPHELPMLDEVTMAEDDDLAAVVDEVIVSDPAARAAQRLIVEQQEYLQPLLPPEQWVAVLRMEELMTARWGDLVITITRWAFEAGRRAGREEG